MSASTATPVPGAPERILMVAPYAPYRDGIAAYALQQVRALRAEGHDVEVLSPSPSAAHHHLDLADPRAVLGLPALAAKFDRVIVHFHPDYFLPQPATFGVRLSRFVTLAAVIHRCPPATLVVHEMDARWGTAGDLSARAARAFMQAFARIEVHYRHQATELTDDFGVDPARVALILHGVHFRANTRLDRATARQRLGIAPDAFVFLCIGFVAHHKGFDRAVRALGRLGLEGEVASRVRLDVVGSPSTGSEAAEQYALELEALIDATRGATLHRGYVSDAAFDEWLLACDVVLLPYRHIWSSSVVERAALFDRRIIATAVGGLAEQLEPIAGARAVHDDQELVGAMATTLADAGLVESDAAAVAAEPWDVAASGPEVLAEVRRRADARRGYSPRRVSQTTSTSVGARSKPGVTVADERALAALRRIGPLSRPVPVSARPGVTLFKKAQRRLFNWEIEPLIAWVDELRRATQRVAESTVAEPPGTEASGPVSPSGDAATGASRSVEG